MARYSLTCYWLLLSGQSVSSGSKPLRSTTLSVIRPSSKRLNDITTDETPSLTFMGTSKTSLLLLVFTQDLLVIHTKYNQTAYIKHSEHTHHQHHPASEMRPSLTHSSHFLSSHPPIITHRPPTHHHPSSPIIPHHHSSHFLSSHPPTHHHPSPIITYHRNFAVTSFISFCSPAAFSNCVG